MSFGNTTYSTHESAPSPASDNGSQAGSSVCEICSMVHRKPTNYIPNASICEACKVVFKYKSTLSMFKPFPFFLFFTEIFTATSKTKQEETSL